VPVTGPALAEAQAALAAGAPAAIPSTLDPTGAIEGAEGFANSDQPPATAELYVDDRPAADTVDDFTSEDRETEDVKVDANTMQAIATMQLLYLLANALKPVMTVGADTGPARFSALAAAISISNLTPRIGVDAYLDDYPSASEIARRIGTVRVPVDAYLRNTPRINGNLID
jgi:hypothetical protein